MQTVLSNSLQTASFY